MKQLRVEYNGIVLFDGQVDEVSWSDSDSGVTVTGKMRRAGGGGGGAAGLLELLTSGRQRQTESVVADKRAELAAEKAEMSAPQGQEIATF